MRSRGSSETQVKSKLDRLSTTSRTTAACKSDTSGHLCVQLTAFDDLAKKMRKSLHALKRNYVIKLFADHAHTQSLFAARARDLANLIG